MGEGDHRCCPDLAVAEAGLAETLTHTAGKSEDDPRADSGDDEGNDGRDERGDEHLADDAVQLLGRVTQPVDLGEPKASDGRANQPAEERV